MNMERIECSETWAYKIQTPGNHPEENIQQVDNSLSSWATVSFSRTNMCSMELKSYVVTAARYEYIRDRNKQSFLSADRTSRFIACAND
jgi:hypothetical protein